MTLKMKATRVAALSLLLAPMALSTFQSVSNVYATGNDTTLLETTEIYPGFARVLLNKRQYSVMPDNTQNTGQPMDFGGHPLAEVTFDIYDISGAIYEARSSGVSVATLANATISIGDDDTVTIAGVAYSNNASHYDITEPTGINGVTSIDLPQFTVINVGDETLEIDAAYLIREKDRPANVTQGSLDLLLMFPVYEMTAEGTYTDNLLNKIYLYPKNATTTSNILVNKQVQSLDGPVEHEGAVFVVQDYARRYLTEERTWATDRNQAAEFTTNAEGQVAIMNIPWSDSQSDYYLVERDSGYEGVSIPQDLAEGKHFVLDNDVDENGFDYIFALGDLVNNDLDTEKSVEDMIIDGHGYANYTVEYMFPEDFDYITEENGVLNWKYQDFFLLDQHNAALTLESIYDIVLDIEGMDNPMPLADMVALGVMEFYDLDNNPDEIKNFYQLANKTTNDLPTGEDFFAFKFVDVSELQGMDLITAQFLLGEMAGKKATIEYRLRLTNPDVADVELINTATLYTGSETQDSSTSVYTGGKKFIKIDVDTEDRLAGAKFYIVNDEGDILYTDEDGNREFISVDVEDLVDDLAPETIDGYNLVMLTSGADGSFEIQGLEYGTELDDIREYTLMEYATSNDRYILPESGFTFEVTHGSYLNAEEFSVTNKAKSPLPNTGGMGTIVFFLIGAATMAGAVYVVRKNKKTA